MPTTESRPAAAGTAVPCTAPRPAAPRPAAPHPAAPAAPRWSAPTPPAARGLLELAWDQLLAAREATDAAERYAGAHLAALRVAAAVLAARARPRRAGRPTSAWVLLPRVAPELSEWAVYFAAGAAKRSAAEAGLRGAVSVREADDLIRAVETFLAAVEVALGMVVAEPMVRVG
jgi:hypothetical protein